MVTDTRLSTEVGNEASENTPDSDATESAAQRAYPLRAVPFLVPWVADGLPADVTARVLGEAGPAYRLLLRLCRPRYARAERRAFAHT